jgi:hypothetical protein
MHEWYSFAQDAFALFQQMSITHDIAVQYEDELYTVGKKYLERFRSPELWLECLQILCFHHWVA